MGTLLALRDSLASTRNLATGAYMACHALGSASTERAALCEVTNLVRERLEAALADLDAMIVEGNKAAHRADRPKRR